MTKIISCAQLDMVDRFPERPHILDFGFTYRTRVMNPDNNGSGFTIGAYSLKEANWRKKEYGGFVERLNKKTNQWNKL